MSVVQQDPLLRPPRLWLLFLCITGSWAGVVKTGDAVTAVLGQDVTLPCTYEAQEGEEVSQVVWSRAAPGGAVTQIATLHAQFGAYMHGEYQRRVTVTSPRKPEDGTITLRNAVQADQGLYQCRVNTFPAGTFEADLRLTVLVPPLPTLNPGPALVEGVGQTLAASCTAEGNPAPTLSWDTEVIGTNSTRTFVHERSVSVTGEFYVVPSRSMNGKTLTCVIAHPGFPEDKRIAHRFSVLYIAEASITGNQEWFVGKEGAALHCECDGNPPPTYTWSRLNGSLPEDAMFEENRMVFPGPLTAAHAGTYSCQAANEVGRRQATTSVVIAAYQPQKVDVVSLSLVAVAVVTAILLVILVVIVVLVNRHHKRKTKQLSDKIEELSTLSRQNSRRRLSTSASTDTRMQLEESLHLRLHSESLRDPSLNSMLGEEADRRSYSTLTTVRETETQTELLTTVPDEEAGEEEEPEERREGTGEEREQREQREQRDQREQREQDATQPFIKQAMNHFYQENGTLRAKPSTHSIYINGRGHLV